MKKIIAMILALVMVASMAACAKKPAEDTTTDDTTISEDNTQNEGTTEDETAEDDTATDDTAEDDTTADDTAEDDTTADDTTDVDPEQPATPEAPVDGTENTNPETPATDGETTVTPEEQEVLDTLQKLVAGAADDIMCDNTIITADQYPYYLFIDYIDGSIAASASAMIGSIAHSVVLLKLPEDADVAAVAADIEANMDPRKWICVEAEATMVKTSGQYVLMAMSSQEIVDAISANFDTVFGA